MVELVKTDILNANTYLPIKEKAAIAQLCAGDCLTEFEVTGEFAMPPLYAPDTTKKNRVMMGIFMYRYLNMPYTDETKLMLDPETYDAWAGSHVLNQLERMKSDPEMRNRVFDLIADYKATEKALSVAISSLCELRNDPCSRMLSTILAAIKPEAVAEAQRNLEAAAGELQAYIAERVSVQPEKQQEAAE